MSDEACYTELLLTYVTLGSVSRTEFWSRRRPGGQNVGLGRSQGRNVVLDAGLGVGLEGLMSFNVCWCDAKLDSSSADRRTASNVAYLRLFAAALHRLPRFRLVYTPFLIGQWLRFPAGCGLWSEVRHPLRRGASIKLKCVHNWRQRWFSHKQNSSVSDVTSCTTSGGLDPNPR